MPAHDIWHETVKKALIKDGWIISDDPLSIQFGGVDVYIDLAAEKLIIAEKEGKKIAIEVKSFLGDSTTYEFHTAVGQFINYRIVLAQSQPDRILYLAVPSEIYQTFFETQFARLIIEKTAIKVLVYDSEQEEIEAWIN